MSESYNGWTLNSVGDAADVGAVAGCGTQEVTNWKNVVDKVGPPNGTRLLEIGSPSNSKFVKIDDAANFHATVSSILTELYNGININKATGEAYLSLSAAGFEKIWISKEATTNDLIIAMSDAGVTALRIKQSNGDVAIGDVSPAGINHLLADLSLGVQRGINKNVGPLGTGFTRDTTAPLVNVSDSGVITDGNALNFLFSGNYTGLLGHGDIHAFDTVTGTSYYCHFSIRCSSTTGDCTITLDFGDISGGGQKFFISDAGTGIRLLISSSAGPNYNPYLIVKNSFGGSVDIAYNFHLRKCIFVAP
jgi:hypothetical protein